MHQTTTRKICMLCGSNCADRPRIKDPKGRYSCRDCYEEALERRTRRHAAAARAEASPVVIEEILEASGSHVAFALKPCPSCGMPVAETAVLCTRCGFDERNGRGHDIRVEHRVPPAPAAGPRFVARELFSPFGVAVLVTMLFATLLVMSSVSTRAAVVYLALEVVFGICLGIAILVAAFRESIGHGLGLIFLPVAASMIASPIAGTWGDAIASCVSMLYVIYVVFWICESQYLRWLFLVNLLTATGLMFIGSTL